MSRQWEDGVIGVSDLAIFSALTFNCIAAEKIVGGNPLPACPWRNLKPKTETLVQIQPDDSGRIARADGVKLVLRQSEGFHVAANETHRLDRIGKQWFARVAR
jgi:hypothetical protein